MIRVPIASEAFQESGVYGRKPGKLQGKPVKAKYGEEQHVLGNAERVFLGSLGRCPTS